MINTDGNNYQRLYSFGGQANNQDGAKPIDNVIYLNGWLYGMTTEGGAHNLGTIFQVCPTAGVTPRRCLGHRQRLRDNRSSL